MTDETLDQDVLCFSETWKQTDLEIEGYQCVTSHAADASRRGRAKGGLLTALKTGIDFEPIRSSTRHLLHVKLANGLHIINAYFPPDTGKKNEPFPVEDIMTHVSEQLALCGSDPVIVVGDFNCRIDSDNDSRGEELIESMELLNLSLTRHHPEKTFRRRLDNDKEASSTIDLCFSNCHQLHIKSTVASGSVTDHIPIYLQWKFPTETTEEKLVSVSRKLDPTLIPETARVDIYKLLSEDKLDEAVASLEETIERACIPPPVPKKRPWFNSTCYAAKRRMMILIKQGIPHWEAKSHFDRLVKTCRKDYYEQLQIKRVEMSEHQPWKLFARRKKLRLPFLVMKTSEAHLSQILQEPLPHLPLETITSPEPLTVSNEESVWNTNFTPEDVFDALLSGKDKKAPGHDRITYEVLKASSTLLLEAITAIFNYCLSHSVLPSAWKTSSIILLYKGKGQTSDPDNYRGICLQCNFYKILTKLVKRRIESQVEEKLSDSQFGFRKNRSTVQAIERLIDEIQRGVWTARKKRTEKKQLYVTFVDFKKAFDSVPREILLRKIEQQFGVTGKILLLVKSIMSPNKVVVVDKEWRSNPITQNRGIIQGDSLSPYLFTLFIDDISERVGGGNIKTILYADDLAILSPTLKETNEALARLLTWSKESRMEVNINKTKQMKFRRGGGVTREDLREGAVFDNQKLELVNEFCYLGITFQATRNTFTNHIERIKRRCLAVMAASFWDISKVSLVTAMKIFNMKILPMITYGLCSISPHLKSFHFTELDRIKSIFLKRLLAVPLSTNNSLVYTLTEEQRLSQTLIMSANSFDFDHEECYKYRDLVVAEDREMLKKGYSDGPAFKCSSWKQALDKRRHAIVGFTAHGFHHLICNNKKWHSHPTSSCVCTLCGCSDLNRLHALSCSHVINSLPASSSVTQKHNFLLQLHNKTQQC